MVVLDIEMPEMDGRQAILAIRDYERAHGTRPIPVMALTAHNGEKEHREYLKAGFNAVVTKPLRSEEISVALQRVTAH